MPDVTIFTRLDLGGFTGFRVTSWTCCGWTLAFMWKEEE